MPRTHVYRHFDDKQALDLAVSSHIGAQIAERIRVALASRGSVRAIVAASVDEHLGWLESHPNLYRFLAQHAYAVRLSGSADAVRLSGSADAVDAKAAFAAELTDHVWVLLDRSAQRLGLVLDPDEPLPRLRPTEAAP